MSEISIIGEIKSIEKRADGSDWLEVELSAEGMALLKIEHKIVKVVNFERRREAVIDIHPHLLDCATVIENSK